MDQMNGIIAISTMGYDRNLMLCDSGRGACNARCRECQAIETDLLRLSRVVLMIVRWRVVMRMGPVVVMAMLMLMLVLVVPVRMGIAVMEMRDNMLKRMGMAVVMGGAVEMMMAEGEREFEHQRQ